jgi:hypothetical protein
MKRYIIKNADGSEQTVMPAAHDTRKEAMLTLLRHITLVVEETNDDCIGDPFNYTIEEVDEKDVNERITDFESARQALGRKPNTGFHVVKEKLSESDLPLKGVARLVEDINPKHIEALISLNKLFTIAQAWNKEDGFVPDFSDWNQDKWFPWFKYDEDAAGFVFAHTLYAPTYAFAHFGSRLCFKSSTRAAQFGKQFADLYNKVFLPHSRNRRR